MNRFDDDDTQQGRVQTRLLYDSTNLLREIRDRISAEPPRSESRSHVELNEDSKGKVHPTIKAYEGSPLGGLLEDAMATLCEAKLALPSEETIEAWEATLEWARARQQERLMAGAA